jgi:hypothetical protein
MSQSRNGLDLPARNQGCRGSWMTPTGICLYFFSIQLIT